MKDWAASIIASALFGFLSPGVIIQMAGRYRPVEFFNMKTSCVSILVHALIFAILLMLFLIILHPHLYI
ncbi:uncharacterized protein LOC110111086 [Dendrobium catenatum]|uniref:Uncharacterized protein n=1 Tax=Dendrobium catenatum TaxID=906689 RepID=A0A2I0WI51_9ASPA|nr:uncharacterized protein LOC110111086 [Dendrobium catenatum]PKU75322.1 hypothetical protein MA16_Dca024071 [Dendrobium catenatum]